MSYSEIDVLIVAENQDNIKLYDLILRNNDYRIKSVSNVLDAISETKDKRVKVVLCDSLAVEEQVIVFFEKLELHDACIQKILVADFIDHINISEVISRGRIFNYIKKPIEPKRINVVVHKALEQYGLLKKNEELLINVREKNLELRELVNELKEEEEKFRNIFNSSPDPKFIIDGSGVILETNPKAIIFCCKDKCSCKGRTVFEVVAKDDVIKLSNYVNQLNSGKNEWLEIRGRSESGNKRQYELTSSPLKYKGAKAFILIFRDVSERKEMQKKVMQTVIQTEEKERRRFAQELHDGIGPLLSTTKLYLQWFNKPQAKMDKGVIISKMEETLDETILSLREISNNISPNTLMTFGLESALRKFISRINNVSKIQINFNCVLQQRLEQQVEITIYRLVCELIHNSLKHSNAKTIKISIKDMDIIDVCYMDDGDGFDVEHVIKQNKGSGLVNIINRVESLGGEHHISSKKGAGTKIEIGLNK
ncbi:PAS domain S-box protein [Labilibacter marinus]|uniref:PAS domain S-box protein n=1 Tax=Labilibacter marinus TaxID=1477105 RepID=UPI00094F805F|nr:PAS domain S-box protein [Labilibacter marinus]